MTRVNRREFLATSSVLLAAAGIGSSLGPRLLYASTPRALARTPRDLLPDPTSDELLTRLATAAIDAAKSAGATYADVRVIEQQSFHISMARDDIIPGYAVDASLAFGIRTIVNGTWGFVYGHTPTVDAIAALARQAVGQARGSSAMTIHPVTLAPVPPATGEWSSPTDIVPFSVSLRDQTVQLGVLNAAIGRVEDTSRLSSSGFQWTQETRVFASTDGAKTIQRLMRAVPSVSIMISPSGEFPYTFTVPNLTPQVAGYESVIRPDLTARIKHTADDAARVLRLPVVSRDAGRAPAVFTGRSLGTLTALTLSTALELDRVLGYEADGVGTSFLAPPLDILNADAAAFAPVLTVTADRNAPDQSAVKWDDEGVVPESYTLIERGRVVDYHTTRDTVPVLAEWYRKHDRPVRAHGCIVAQQGDDLPLAVGGHTTVAPAAQPMSVDALLKEMRNGTLVYEASAQTASTLSTGMVSGLLLDIRDGVPVGRYRGAGLMFRTTPLWKDSLVALGGPESQTTATVLINKGQPMVRLPQSVTAPAALMKDMTLVDFGKN